MDEELFELVSVNAYTPAVEPVAIALARDRLTKKLACVSDGLIEAVTAALRIFAWPKRFEDLIPLRALAPEGKERDQLKGAGAQASAAPPGAVDRERAEKGDERPWVRLRDATDSRRARDSVATYTD